MTARVDDFLTRRRGPDYNCLDLTCEVWRSETGEDISEILGSDLTQIGRHLGVRNSGARRFRKIASPISPCLVVMHGQRGAFHIGVFLRGRVLHLRSDTPEWMEVEVASRGHKRTAFYR